MKGTFFIALFLWGPTLYAQEINAGPRLTSLGNTGVALHDVWSLHANQAGITGLLKPTVAGAYKSSYINSEVSTQSLVLVYPVKSNVFGIGIQNYGFSKYAEQRFSATYAKQFGKSVALALNYNFHQLSVPQYGNTRTFSVEAGLQYQAGRSLLLGAHISNPNQSKFDSEIDAPIPVMLQFGASYQFSKGLLLSSAISQELNSVTDFKVGLEYAPASAFAFRGGLNVNPFMQFGGFGYKLKGFCFDAAVSVHPALGYAPQIALGYEF
ncbi:hypothetical protein [Pedobacter sp. SYSU D00535]|uniref:hypothetical protein n=1 Tax=Pedobacter sp. SYSU D00535 TaxID=2810308 RepID=UPI001A963A07|nr:hypothetical protein [Pedobacter sp. SYSU D00535]